MRERWLPLVVIAFLGLIVFTFFALRLRPIALPALQEPKILGGLTAPEVTFVNPARGADASRATTLVVFSDFECPACKTIATSLEVALRTRPDEVRVVWKNLPNESAHPNATPAAVAAHCADRQGKFWEYHDLLFARQAYLDPSQFAAWAGEIGLNARTFQNCYDALDTLPIVKKDFDEGMALGITATPTVYVGATPYVGALTADDLLSAIDRARANP